MANEDEMAPEARPRFRGKNIPNDSHDSNSDQTNIPIRFWLIANFVGLGQAAKECAEPKTGIHREQNRSTVESGP